MVGRVVLKRHANSPMTTLPPQQVPGLRGWLNVEPVLGKYRLVQVTLAAKRDTTDFLVVNCGPKWWRELERLPIQE